jgi:hypothetical protein
MFGHLEKMAGVDLNFGLFRLSPDIRHRSVVLLVPQVLRYFTREIPPAVM